jgi:uncharacterized coiled-coil DUF342 family protein
MPKRERPVPGLNISELRSQFVNLRSKMEHQEDTDQFKALEDSVAGLINKVSSLKADKEQLTSKFDEQEKIIADLKSELDNLRKVRDNAKIRIQSILDKIGKMDI